MDRGFGVAGALDQAVVREIAVAAEAAGYRTLWVNDTPEGDALAALAAVAPLTSRIRLAAGVIPLDRQPAERVAERVRELGLPVERVTLGIGAGGDPGGLALVREGATLLRERTGATVTIGALGPKMCALAGEVADGVLLNWLTPDFARSSAAIVRQAARSARRPAPRIDGYVRTALGAAALPRLRREAARYERYAKYAAHFARMGVAAIDTCVAGDTADAIQPGLAVYAASLDEVVVRAITADDSAASYLTLLKTAAPR